MRFFNLPPWKGNKVIYIISFLYIIGTLIAGINNILLDKINTQTDFYVFWNAGNNFMSGNDLYQPYEGVRSYFYPPQAAMFFQILSVLPYKLSAFIFYCLHIFLTFYCAKIIKDILKHTYPQFQRFNSIIFLSSLFSLNYLWSNISANQVNQILFFTVLISTYYFLKNKPSYSIAITIVATFFKVLPILFIPYFLFRAFSLKNIGISILITGALIIAPMAQRGFDGALHDYKEYYVEFLSAFKNGKVIPTYTNQNVTASVYRAFMGSDKKEDVPKLGAQEVSRAKQIIFIINIFFLTAYLLIVVPLKRKGTNVLLDISSIVLVMHLISGITWKAHLVTFQFVLVYFLLIDYKCLKAYGKTLYYSVFVLIGICGLESSDILGPYIHKQIGFYNLFVWLMFFLLTFYMYATFKSPKIPLKTIST